VGPAGRSGRRYCGECHVVSSLAKFSRAVAHYENLKKTSEYRGKTENISVTVCRPRIAGNRLLLVGERCKLQWLLSRCLLRCCWPPPVNSCLDTVTLSAINLLSCLFLPHSLGVSVRQLTTTSNLPNIWNPAMRRLGDGGLRQMTKISSLRFVQMSTLSRYWTVFKSLLLPTSDDWM